MVTRLLSSTVGAILVAVITWMACRPLAPVVLIDYSQASKPESSEHYPIVQAIFGAYGPTFYSMVLSLVFGFLLCSLCSYIHTDIRAQSTRISQSLIAGIIGGLAFCLATYLFDHTSQFLVGKELQLERGGGHIAGYGVRLSNWFFWSLQAAALSIPVYLSIGFRMDSWIKFAAIVLCTATVVSGIVYIAHQVSIFYFLGSTLAQAFEMTDRYQRHLPMKLPTTNYYVYQQTAYLANMAAQAGCLGFLAGIVQVNAPKGWLLHTNGIQTMKAWPVVDPIVEIGCDPMCRIYCNQIAGFATRHARVHRYGTGFSIKDLGSPAGILLNGSRVFRASLKNGDKIQLGGHSFIFTTNDPSLTPIHASERPSADPSMPSLAPLRQAALGVVVDSFGNRYALNQDRLSVGRAKSCAICLSWEQTVSMHHADIVRDSDTYRIVDRQSSNSTKVNGIQISAPVALVEGDVIELGSAKLTFEYAKEKGLKPATIA